MPLCEPWATETDLADTPGFDLDGMANIELALALASEILYGFTDGAYPGICEDTIRPASTCGCVQRCRCGYVSEIALPGWPAVAVVEVLIDGLPVDAERYRIDNHRNLVWLPDPDDPDTLRGWPRRQNADAPSTDEGTWEVTYEYGVAPPRAGVICAAVLAYEIALSLTPDLAPKCRLPKNTVSLTKKNVGHAMADPAQLAERGETGLPEVDLWLRSDRWSRKNRGGAVRVPGQPRARRTTWPGAVTS